MQQICTADHCTGCGACLNGCSRQAIQMQENGKGYCYPHINDALCVNCGKCTVICPALHKVEGSVPKTVLAAFDKNEASRKKSSSGGIFACLADKVLATGGSVFGAAMDVDLTVRHREITCPADLDQLRGSKYVQSEIGLCYQQAEQRLRENKPVLFSGTPCQIAGLKAFLGKEYPNLLTVDILCHGVPSPGLFRKYVAGEESLAGAKMTEMQFRSKRIGWKKFYTVRRFENGTEADWPDTFVPGFLQNLYLRDSCYSCKYATEKRQGDITLGDYWGYTESAPAYLEDDDKGISLVLINSEKGRQAFSKIRSRLAVSEKNLENAKAGNQVLYKPCDKPAVYESFWQDAITLSWTELKGKYIAEQDTADWMDKEQRAYFDIPFRKRQWKHCLRRIAGASFRRIKRLIRKH